MIPSKLWKKNILYQSDKLVGIYKDKLLELNLYDKAKNHTEKNKAGATGGKNEDETNKHFTERFLTSSARAQFVVIDPRGDFSEISKDLKVTFGSGNISILDIPAGTGAGILSLLCNLAELRNNYKLPRLPLHINIMAGDYSQSALDIYASLLSSAKKDLEGELIFINCQTFLWDAAESVSTNLLARAWLKDEENYEEFYIFMSAFSGVGSSNYKKFEDSFKFIQTYISHLRSTSIYIEPETVVASSFLKKVSATLEKIATWLKIKEESTNGERFKWHDEIRDNIAKSDVLVKLYSRG